MAVGSLFWGTWRSANTSENHCQKSWQASSRETALIPLKATRSRWAARDSAGGSRGSPLRATHCRAREAVTACWHGPFSSTQRCLAVGSGCWAGSVPRGQPAIVRAAGAVSWGCRAAHGYGAGWGRAGHRVPLPWAGTAPRAGVLAGGSWYSRSSLVLRLLC